MLAAVPILAAAGAPYDYVPLNKRGPDLLDPTLAVKEAEADIVGDSIKIFWEGTFALFPVGLPAELFKIANTYPMEVVGRGSCRAPRRKFDAQRIQYARAYNERIAEYLKALSPNIPLEGDGQTAPQLGR